MVTPTPEDKEIFEHIKKRINDAVKALSPKPERPNSYQIKEETQNAQLKKEQ